MSRDPMAVLRLAASMAECGVPQAEVDEAIAQVEALALAARGVVIEATVDPKVRVESGTWKSCNVLREVLTPFIPFTPGQDSDGAA